MLETLEHEGYVTRNPTNSGYRVTGRTLQLSRGYDIHQRIGQASEPILAEFRKAIGWPSFALPIANAHRQRVFRGMRPCV